MVSRPPLSRPKDQLPAAAKEADLALRAPHAHQPLGARPLVRLRMEAGPRSLFEEQALHDGM